MIPYESLGLEQRRTISLDGRVRTCLLINEAHLSAWIADAVRGDRIEYFRGFLAIDRLPGGSRLPAEQARELNRVANAALALSDAKRVDLVQLRLGPGEFSYICIARRRCGVPGAER